MPRPALTRLAAACAAAVPATAMVHVPAPAGADEPLLVESCTTDTLPIEDVQGGATTEVVCDWVEQGELVSRFVSSDLVAIHYDATSGNGMSLAVWGACGESIAFDAGDPWNNIVSSTAHRVCGSVKHFANAVLSGTSETTTGGYGAVRNLLTLDNQVSSIGYNAT